MSEVKKNTRKNIGKYRLMELIRENQIRLDVGRVQVKRPVEGWSKLFDFGAFDQYHCQYVIYAPVYMVDVNDGMPVGVIVGPPSVDLHQHTTDGGEVQDRYYFDNIVCFGSELFFFDEEEWEELRGDAACATLTSLLFEKTVEVLGPNESNVQKFRDRVAKNAKKRALKKPDFQSLTQLLIQHNVSDIAVAVEAIEMENERFRFIEDVRKWTATHPVLCQKLTYEHLRECIETVQVRNVQGL